MARKGAVLTGSGLFDTGEAPEPAPKAKTIFQQADALLYSKGWPEAAVQAFNNFLGAYCKNRGRPTLEDIVGWVAVLERYREWKMDFDDIRYLINWCRQSGRYYITLPPEMRTNGEYWFEKGGAAAQGQRKVGKAY